jgi:hypothetical protein
MGREEGDASFGVMEQRVKFEGPTTFGHSAPVRSWKQVSHTTTFCIESFGAADTVYCRSSVGRCACEGTDFALARFHVSVCFLRYVLGTHGHTYKQCQGHTCSCQYASIVRSSTQTCVGVSASIHKQAVKMKKFTCRMLSVVSALALALVTNRSLAVDWGKPFEGLFQTPSFGWGMDHVK